MPVKRSRCLTRECPRNRRDAEGMGSELSMATRVEITKKYARAYAKASKKERGRLLDEVIGVTG